MADTIDKVSERLTNLEVTVAQGFHDMTKDMTKGFEDAKQRDAAQARKIDLNTERLHEGIRSLAKEIRRDREAD